MNVVVIRLLSYAPLHFGEERWKRVTKSGWKFIPGSTLFGALAHILIKCTCIREDAQAVNAERCLDCLAKDESPCGYARLQKEVCRKHKEKIRFSPLVVSSPQHHMPYTAAAYSEDALDVGGPRMTVLPRAPINRERHTIHGDQLHGVIAHQPFQCYRGYVYTHSDFIPTLQSALRMLPFFSFGGARGKFSQVEGVVEHTWDSPQDFLPKKPSSTLRLLTPAIVSGDDLKPKSMESISGFQLRRYRFWRTGLYYEAGDWGQYGASGEDDIQGAHGSMTNAQLGLREGAVLRLKSDSKTKLNLPGELFLRGLGDRDFTYLGWGQVVFQKEEPV